MNYIRFLINATADTRMSRLMASAMCNPCLLSIDGMIKIVFFLFRFLWYHEPIVQCVPSHNVLHLSHQDVKTAVPTDKVPAGSLKEDASRPRSSWTCSVNTPASAWLTDNTLKYSVRKMAACTADLQHKTFQICISITRSKRSSHHVHIRLCRF